MKKLTALCLAITLTFANAAPVSKAKNKLVVTEESYPETLLVYSGEHEIVNIIVPVNNLNFGSNDYLFFFVEADKDITGKSIDRGLYVFKEGEAKKLLEYGRDAAAAPDDGTEAFIAAADGIYLYNDEKVSVEKYGSISDSIVGIEKPTEEDLIFVLIEDGNVFKVIEGGNKKEQIKEIVSAKQILLDYFNNLYYIDAGNHVYIYDEEGARKIIGLPDQISDARLLKPAVISDGNVPLVVDDKLYMLYDDDAELYDNIEFAPGGKPSAYGTQAGLTQFFARDKRIYQFDILHIELSLIEFLLEELTDSINLLISLFLP